MTPVPVFFSLILGSGTILSLPLARLTLLPVHDRVRATNSGGGDVVRIERAVRDPVIVYGDIAVRAQTRDAESCSVKGCRWPNRSSGFVKIPVNISSEYTAEDRDMIALALLSFHRVTCIRFYWRTTETDYIYIFPGEGCWSHIGRQGGMQQVSLPKFCMSQRTMQHEVLHALGFHHEQVRKDRNNYITINMDNVDPDRTHNFDMVDSNNMITAYDYASVLQYGRYAFSKKPDVLETIVPVPDRNTVIGQAKVLSPLDIDKVNLFYQCSDDS